MEIMRQLHVLMHVKGGLPFKLLFFIASPSSSLTRNHISKTNLIYNMPFVNLALLLGDYSTSLGLSVKLGISVWEIDLEGRNREWERRMRWMDIFKKGRYKQTNKGRKKTNEEWAEYQDHGHQWECSSSLLLYEMPNIVTKHHRSQWYCFNCSLSLTNSQTIPKELHL